MAQWSGNPQGGKGYPLVLFLVWLTIPRAVSRMPTGFECDTGGPTFISRVFVFLILSTAKDMPVPFNNAEEFPSDSTDQKWKKL